MTLSQRHWVIIVAGIITIAAPLMLFCVGMKLPHWWDELQPGLTKREAKEILESNSGFVLARVTRNIELEEHWHYKTFGGAWYLRISYLEGRVANLHLAHDNLLGKNIRVRRKS